MKSRTVYFIGAVVVFTLIGVAISAWKLTAPSRAQAEMVKFDNFIISGAEMDNAVAVLNNDLADEKPYDKIMDDKWAILTAITKHEAVFKASEKIMDSHQRELYSYEIERMYSSLPDIHDATDVMTFAKYHIGSIEARAQMIGIFQLKYYPYRTLPAYSIQLNGKPVFQETITVTKR